MHSKTKRIVMTALMAAMACVATMIIKIPTPMQGYVNLGDCIVLLCGWFLAPGYGFFAAALGSALADLISGYIIYAPATFLIKGGMALLAFYLLRMLKGRIGRFPARLIGAILAEILMVLGYLAFESILYGFLPSVVNIPANAAQGLAGILIGLLFASVIDRLRISFD